MTTMVEKVARAIAGERAEPWDNMNEDERRSWLETARAAMVAMRGPTRGMVEDGYAALMDWDARTGEDKGISDTWVAMIDAALGDKNAD